MTEQEAKIQIQSIPSKIWEQLSQSDNEAIEIAFKSLEKQIEKKPELIEGKMWTCPCCDNNLMHKWLKYPTELMPLSEGLPYCMACGQKILWDWGNEDEE